MRKAQLFVIEVIVAVSVVILLLSSLLSVQTLNDPPADVSELYDTAEAVVEALVESGDFYKYVDAAYSAYLASNTLSDSDVAASVIVKSLKAALPSTAKFKAFLSIRTPAGQFSAIDSLNSDPIPSQVEIANYQFFIEGYYSPVRGHVNEAFIFLVQAWYEVG